MFTRASEAARRLGQEKTRAGPGCREAVRTGVRHLDAEGVGDDVEEQAEVAAGRAAVRRCVVRRLGDDLLCRVHRQSPEAQLSMPTSSEAHPGLKGRNEVLKSGDGTAVGRSDGAFTGRPTTDPKHIRILELRYGTIRAQALPPRESPAFIEQLLGET